MHAAAAVDHGKSTLTDSLVAAAGIIAMETVRIARISCHSCAVPISRQRAAPKLRDSILASARGSGATAAEDPIAAAA